jgi:hypothetical protein
MCLIEILIKCAAKYYLKGNGVCGFWRNKEMVLKFAEFFEHTRHL